MWSLIRKYIPKTCEVLREIGTTRKREAPNMNEFLNVQNPSIYFIVLIKPLENILLRPHLNLFLSY